MKVVILAGGFGTRLSEETMSRPKPLVEIGGRPILWHIMKHYTHYGFTEFHIALGYKGEAIKRYFLDYHTLIGNMSIHLAESKVEVNDKKCEDWIVHLIDTGLQTETGGRVKRLQPQLQDATFMLTYGDGVANLNLSSLLQFHQSHDCIATVTGVRPPARFGGLIFNGDRVTQFTEKPQIGEGWINGGFMVLEPEIFNYIKDEDTVLERDVLETLAVEGQLVAYRHEGFWQCMDTLRDLRLLDSLWQSGNAPWRVWAE
jgi:glucose-1-phosphate cytidylyltransferase